MVSTRLELVRKEMVFNHQHSSFGDGFYQYFCILVLFILLYTCLFSCIWVSKSKKRLGGCVSV